MGAEETKSIASILGELGNETRLEIFQLLVRAGAQGATVGEIKEALDMPGSTLSHHFGRLINVGLITQVRQGRKLICHADCNTVLRVVGFLTKECCSGISGCGRS